VGILLLVPTHIPIPTPTHIPIPTPKPISLPGYDPTSTNGQTFWVSFWAGLLSGSIYSLMIGGLIAYGIYRAQIKTNRDQFARQCQVSLSMLAKRLRIALNQAAPVDLMSAWNTIREPVKEVSRLLDEQPIALWNSYLPNDQPLFDQFYKWQRAYGNYGVNCNRIDAFIHDVVEDYNKSAKLRGPTQDFVKKQIGYCVGMLRYGEDQEVNVAFHIGANEDELRQLRPLYKNIKATDLNSVMNTTPATYARRCRQMETATTQLEESIQTSLFPLRSMGGRRFAWARWQVRRIFRKVKKSRPPT